MKSRIPTYNENAAAWAQAMWNAGFAFHLDDHPADIEIDGQPIFTPEEVDELVALVNRMDEDEREVCFALWVNLNNAYATEVSE